MVDPSEMEYEALAFKLPSGRDFIPLTLKLCLNVEEDDTEVDLFSLEEYCSFGKYILSDIDSLTL